MQLALAAIVIAGSLANLTAAWIPSDRISLATEIGGQILSATAFLVYAGLVVTTVDFWQATSGAAWSFGMLAGTAGRTLQIFRRGW